MIHHFANPVVLCLLLFLPFFSWRWLRKRGAALRHPALGDLAKVPPGRAKLARWGPLILRSFALASLIAALAGPRWPDLHTRIETEGIALMMLVDVSGSMAERDFDWNGEAITRLDAVKKVFQLFVAGGEKFEDGLSGIDLAQFQGRPTDRVGLVTFATRPETACPLTLSHSVLLRILKTEQPRTIPGESETNISDAVAMGLLRLESAGTRRKVIVLLSDGDHNVPRPQSGWFPRQAAQVANGLHIPIYTIDAGGAVPSTREQGVNPTGETRSAATRTLEEMARISHGQYFQARDTQGLLEACHAIDALERTEMQSFQYRRYHEAYPWLALASFALLLGGLTLERTIWRRIP
jgi:Ca-activated chloride channel family protein